MKIAVLGAGAMGCLYGGYLAAAGENVSLIDIWQDHIEAINKNGLVIEGSEGQQIITNLRGFKTAQEVGPVDLVIVFVKATNTEAAMEQAKSLVGPDTMVMTLQNGLGNVEKLSRVIDARHVIVGVSGFGASIVGPGRIRQGGRGETVIGELNGALSPRLENLCNLLNKANFSSKMSNNVVGLVWSKLIGNIGINALGALTGLKNGQLLDYPQTESLMEKVVTEAVEVAAAAGIKILSDNPVQYVKEMALKTAVNRCSMLQDLTAKRITEIAVINGAIVEMGQKHGIATPVNLVLTNLIETIQQTYDLR